MTIDPDTPARHLRAVPGSGSEAPDAPSAGDRTAASAPPGGAVHLRLVAGPDAAPADHSGDARGWARRALALLADERARAAETPLMRVPLPEYPGINLVLKDESRHATGSLKHRLAHALFTHGIASGAIREHRLIVEASSGSTAISQAWFAAKLGLRFLAIVPASTASAKIASIHARGGDVLFAEPGADLDAAARIVAAETGGYYMNQFDRAAAVSDWRGTDNIAASLLAQLEAIGLGAPAWIVAGAGTGGTAATIGRHIRYRHDLVDTRLCVVDPEGSAYFKAFVSDGAEHTCCSTPVVEGIGRGRVGPAFLPGAIDHMVAVSDEGSVSGAHWLARRINRRFGPSTGTNVIGALILAQAMKNRGATGTIAFLGCDHGRRYADTIYDMAWCERNGVGAGGWDALLRRIGEPGFPAAY